MKTINFLKVVVALSFLLSACGPIPAINELGQIKERSVQQGGKITIQSNSATSFRVTGFTCQIVGGRSTYQRLEEEFKIYKEIHKIQPGAEVAIDVPNELFGECDAILRIVFYGEHNSQSEDQIDIK